MPSTGSSMHLQRTSRINAFNLWIWLAVEANEERVSRSTAARAHAENHLSWRRVAGRLLEIYDRVLSRVE